MEQGKLGLLMTRLFEMFDSAEVELHAEFEHKAYVT